MDLTIIFATRNEMGNILPLQARIREVFGVDLPQVIYVDDSDDDTPRVIQESGYPHLRLIHRTREQRTGLLSALVEGLAAVETQYVAILDADGQHPVEVLPNMLALMNTFDYVGGSRFLRGGSAEGLSGLHRKLLSQTLRFIPHLFGVGLSDSLTNYCLFNMSSLDLHELRTIAGPGMMKIQAALLVTSHFERVTEVPIVFGARQAGESKMTFRQGTKVLHELAIFFRYYLEKHFTERKFRYSS